MRTTSTWGSPDRSEDQFLALECWGLRRGRPHRSDAHHGDVRCQHLKDDVSSSCLCVPLVAHGDTVGMLYFEGTELDDARTYIELMAENIGLAIANLQLRDRPTLR